MGRDWALLEYPFVNFSHEVTNQLDVLTDALEDPGTDLPTVLAVLVDDLRTAIPSELGLTVTITQAGDTITLTTVEPLAPATTGASLHLPLDEVTAANPGSTVTFYAARPGAFVDLAEDIRYACRLDGQVVIDGHLHDPLPAAGARGWTGVTGLAELSVINQAIGVLIELGHPPGTARTVLQHRANQTDTALGATAQHLIDEHTPTLRNQHPHVTEIHQSGRWRRGDICCRAVNPGDRRDRRHSVACR
jgi:hypothetical protein